MGKNPVQSIMVWGVGIGALALFGLIMLILFGNLSPSTLGFNNATVLIPVTNESDSTSGIALVFVNQTGYTLTGYNDSWQSTTISAIWADANQSNGTQSGIARLPSGYTLSVPTTNYTLSSGVVRNATNFVYPNASISYSYYFSYTTDIQNKVDSLSTNYTASVKNTGAQFPTVGTILGVAVLLIILVAVLVFAVRKMSGISTSSGGSEGSMPGGDFG